MSQKIVAIIQARLGSTRLPGKVLKPILGKPMLWHMINRVNKSKLIDKIIVATTNNPKDKKIINFCRKNNINVFQGSEENVLERFYSAAQNEKADICIRATADCPLIDPKIIDETIKKFMDGKYDYVAVATGAGVAKEKTNKFPDGLDCEVFSFKVLEKAYKEATSSIEKEHVTFYIWKRSNQFKIGKLESPKDYSKLRFVVDHKNDLKFVRTIYKNLYPKKEIFLLPDIIKFIMKNPNVLTINKENIGKEGYENF
jgi:spore coat polysaccharide biosynthesis protein SpsF